MFGVKTSIQGVSLNQVTAIEDVILSVLKHADPSWAVTLIGQQDGVWKLYAQPADANSFSLELQDDQHDPEAIRQIVFEWYEQYKESRL